MRARLRSGKDRDNVPVQSVVDAVSGGVIGYMAALSAVLQMVNAANE